VGVGEFPEGAQAKFHNPRRIVIVGEKKERKKKKARK
jgi:hypothetical protein